MSGAFQKGLINVVLHHFYPFQATFADVFVLAVYTNIRIDNVLKGSVGT